MRRAGIYWMCCYEQMLPFAAGTDQEDFGIRQPERPLMPRQTLLRFRFQYSDGLVAVPEGHQRR